MYIRIYIHVHTHTCAHTQTHARTHARMHARTHTHTHTLKDIQRRGIDFEYVISLFSKDFFGQGFKVMLQLHDQLFQIECTSVDIEEGLASKLLREHTCHVLHRVFTFQSLYIQGRVSVHEFVQSTPYMNTVVTQHHSKTNAFMYITCHYRHHIHHVHISHANHMHITCSLLNIT